MLVQSPSGSGFIFLCMFHALRESARYKKIFPRHHVFGVLLYCHWHIIQLRGKRPAGRQTGKMASNIKDLQQQISGLQVSVRSAESDREHLQRRNLDLHQRQEDLLQLVQCEGLRLQHDEWQQEVEKLQEDIDGMQRDIDEIQRDRERKRIDRMQQNEEVKEDEEVHPNEELQGKKEVKQKEEQQTNEEEQGKEEKTQNGGEQQNETQEEDEQDGLFQDLAALQIRELELRQNMLQNETKILELRNKVLEEQNQALQNRIETRQAARESRTLSSDWSPPTDDTVQGDPTKPRKWDNTAIEKPKDIGWAHLAADGGGDPPPPPPPSPPPPPTGNRPSCTICDGWRTYRHHKEGDPLRSESKITDTTFFDKNPASYCYVPFEMQLKLMTEALSEAKKALWYAMCDHWPDLCSKVWFESPEEIRFGNQELDDSYENIRQQLILTEGECVPEFDVKVVVDLRNAIAHAAHKGTKAVDDHIRRALELALEIQDRDRVMNIMRIRECLQKAAIETQKEIELQVNDSGEVVKRTDWPKHIARLFRDMKKLEPGLQLAKGRYIYGNVSEKVRQVWRAQHGYTSEDKVPVEKTDW